MGRLRVVLTETMYYFCALNLRVESKDSHLHRDLRPLAMHLWSAT